MTRKKKKMKTGVERNEKRTVSVVLLLMKLKWMMRWRTRMIGKRVLKIWVLLITIVMSLDQPPGTLRVVAVGRIFGSKMSKFKKKGNIDFSLKFSKGR